MDQQVLVKDIVQDKEYKFHEDPAHGWLQVPRAQVKEIADQITSFSHMDEKFVYLEEDNDVMTFLQHLSISSGVPREEVAEIIQNKTEIVVHDDLCHIRKLPKFEARVIKNEW